MNWPVPGLRTHIIADSERKDEAKSKADLSRLIKDGFPNPTEKKMLKKTPRVLFLTGMVIG